MWGSGRSGGDKSHQRSKGTVQVTGPITGGRLGEIPRVIRAVGGGGHERSQGRVCPHWWEGQALTWLQKRTWCQSAFGVARAWELQKEGDTPLPNSREGHSRPGPAGWAGPGASTLPHVGAPPVFAALPLWRGACCCLEMGARWRVGTSSKCARCARGLHSLPSYQDRHPNQTVPRGGLPAPFRLVRLAEAPLRRVPQPPFSRLCD